MKEHVERRHNSSRSKNIDCPMCPKKFYTMESMRRHLRIHTNERPWRCSLCNSEFKHENDMHQHRESIHGDSAKFKDHPKLKCELCPFTTIFPERLTRHLSVHCTERPYVCTLSGCNYRGKRKGALKDHQTLIHKPKPIPCAKPGCTYVAKSKFLLYAHRRTHQGHFRCVFPGCSLKFQNEVTLLNHQKLHDPSRPFQCDRCPAGFEFKRHLKRHMKVHAGKRHLRCTFCDKSTKYSQVFLAHIKKCHQDAQIIVCTEPGCKYSSYNPLDIPAHKNRWHNRNRLFKCECCSYRFNRKKNLK